MRRVGFHTVQVVSGLLLAVVPYLFWVGQGYAQPLAGRSVTIGSATPSAVTSHTFQLTINSTANGGSIVFLYCSNSPLIVDSCTAPAGLSVSGATLASQSGNTGFSMDAADTTASRLVITRPAVPSNGTPSSYVFNNVTNPSAADQTTYVRISTYASPDGTGSLIDNGSVAFSTQTNFSVGAFVPPFLNICVGVTVAADCSQTSGQGLDFGILSPATTRAATSQFAAATNDVSGYTAYLLGTTMTSGNNIINPVAAPTPNRPATNEFGLNLRRNNGPPVGQDPSGNGTAVPAADYDSPDLFSFEPGAELASSPVSTDYTLMTASYIVNVAASESPGVYTTTLTYLVSAEF